MEQPAATTPSDLQPILGRDVDLAALAAALASAAAGRGRLVVVAGEAGMGKTTVVRALADRAEAAGAAVRWGACWEGDAAPPFGAWIDALRRPGGDACAAVAARFEAGDLAPAPSSDDAGAAERGRARFFAEVTDALREVAGDRPQLVVLEDVHWADTGSLLLLRSVAGHLPRMPVLVAATYREEEAPPAGRLGGLGGSAETVSLSGLGVADVTGLLASVLGRDVAPGEAQAVHRQTGGNPLFVVQVARLLASGSSHRLPTGVRDVLDRRLARLSAGCDHVLGAASVTGAEFSISLVAAVAGTSTDAVLAALDEAARAGVVNPVGNGPHRWAFVHDLLREARYVRLGAGERAELHRRAVEALEDRNAPAGVIAHHAGRARFEPDDPRPARLAVAAGRDALAGFAWDDAAELCRRALDLAPPDAGGEDVRGEAWLGLGDAELRRGGAGPAAEAFRAAADIGRRRRRPELIARAALGFASGLGGFEVRLLDQRQLDLLEEAAGALPSGSPLRPLVLARLSVALSFVGSPARRLALADEAVDTSRLLGDDRALAAALAARCDVLAGPDHVDDRLEAASEIVSLARRHDEPSLEFLGRRLRAVALLERRDLTAFDAEVAAYDEAAGRLGDPLYGWYPSMWRAMRAHADGRLDEALRLADEAAAVGAAGGSVNADLLRLVVALFVAVDRRDAAGLAAATDAAASRHPSLFHQAEATAAMLALLDARCGRTDEAREQLRRAGPDLAGRLPKDQEWLAAIAQILAGGVVVDEEGIVGDAYRRALPYAGLGVFEGAGAIDHGVIDRFLGLGAARIGDADAARRHVDAALAAVAESGRLVLAHTLADGAWALLRSPVPADVTRGADLARQAAQAYEALGLERLAAEAGNLVGAGGGRPGPAGPGPGPGGDGRAGGADAGDAGRGLVREGDTWAVTFAGATVRIRHAKGIADLAVLLGRPGQDVHVRTLEGIDDLAPAASPGPALDATAVDDYRRRLRELDDEIDEAEQFADLGRADRLKAERDALVDALTEAFGLAGRARRAGPDPDERLRKAVSARVKASISRLEGLHPALGRHLRHSVRTGFWCCYDPEPPAAPWRVKTGG